MYEMEITKVVESVSEPDLSRCFKLILTMLFNWIKLPTSTKEHTPHTMIPIPSKLKRPLSIRGHKMSHVKPDIKSTWNLLSLLKLTLLQSSLLQLALASKSLSNFIFLLWMGLMETESPNVVLSSIISNNTWHCQAAPISNISSSKFPEPS